MLTLQSSFTYEDQASDDADLVDIFVSYPQLEVFENAGNGPALLMKGKSGHSFSQSLTSKKYFTTVPVGSIFGINYGTDFAKYLTLLIANYAKPSLADLSISFPVDCGNVNSDLISLEAVIFFKPLAYTARPAPEGPTRVTPRVLRGIDDIINPALLRFDTTVDNITPDVAAPASETNRATSRVVAGTIADGRQQTDRINALVESNVYLVNREKYSALLNQILPNIGIENESILLYLLNIIVDLSGNGPTPLKGLDAEFRQEFSKVLQAFGLQANATIYDTVVANFDSLFDFPIAMSKTQPLTIAGRVHVNMPPPATLTANQAAFFHLSAEYSMRNGTSGAKPSTHISHYTWDPAKVPHDNDINFSFSEQADKRRIVGPVTIKLKGFNNVDVYNENFEAQDPILQRLEITVDLNLPLSMGGGDPTDVTYDPTKKIRGKLVSLSKRCSLKGTVILQAKQSNEGNWATVSTGYSDEAGNFIMPYPFGNFSASQALTSLDPGHPTPIQTDPDSSNAQSIPSSFLYILLQSESGSSSDGSTPINTPESSTKGKDDCSCSKAIGAGRLPSQDDLIQSDEYTQDFGQACVNLTVPNRSLREYQYTALVRTSDPDVANYTLSSVTETDPDNPKTTYQLTRNGKIKRKVVDLDNPIKWEDDSEANANLSIYQAVTVATGHILYYKSEFRSDGYSLGDLMYSLPLAPGQKKEIVVIDSSHSLVGTERQSTTQSERLASDLVSERDIADQIGGNIGEQLAGQSSADTWGVSGGGGAAGTSGFASANVGVAGGYASASSQAGQTSGRGLSGHFQEKLRQSLHQNASSYRQMNASVVTTVNEGQKYNAETTAVANHNHCHSMTMLYFQVLRHFAIYQELVDVEECIFVPFLLTKFSMENIPRWADLLAARLLPLTANSYLKLATFFTGRPSHPLLPAFDALEHVKSNWALVDYPLHAFNEETIVDVQGQVTLTVNIPRPKTRYDFILTLPLVNQQVSSGGGGGGLFGFIKSVVMGPISLFSDGNESHTIQVRQAAFDQFMTMDPTYQTLPPAQCIRITNWKHVVVKDASGNIIISFDPVDLFASQEVDNTMWGVFADLMGNNSKSEFLQYYFNNQLLSDWDGIWNNSVAPLLYEKMAATLSIDLINYNYTFLNQYTRGERTMSLSFEGGLPKARKDLRLFPVGSTSSLVTSLSGTPVRFVLRSLRIAYSTRHFSGLLYNGSPNANLLGPGTTLYAPETAAEMRDPRRDDRYLTQKLIQHLNQNLEYYNRVIWYSLDAQRRFLLLDGFHIEIFNSTGKSIGFRSLSSIVKSNLIAVIGNSLVFPVAPGYKVSQSFITEVGEDGESVQIPLLDHYRPENPAPPFRLSVPTRGVYSEALMGACDSCEKLKPDSSQDWTKFTTDEPTDINAVTPPVPTVTDWKAAFKEFATPMISIQNAPAAPDPGVGLAGITELLGKAGIFKDITGLDANQQNAIKTLMSNNEAAKSYAQMASGMAMQAHNTANSTQIMDTAKSAKDGGALSQDDYSKIVKSHLQQQIDGGATLRADIESRKAAEKPTLEDAAVAAAASGQPVTASMMDASGNSRSMSLVPTARPGTPAAPDRITQAEVRGVTSLKQKKSESCWVAAITMLVRWKYKLDTLSEEDVLTSVAHGSKWMGLYNQPNGKSKGLENDDDPVFMQDFGLVSEPRGTNPTIKRWIELINTYGPLYVTINGDLGATGLVRDHVWIVTKIESNKAETYYWVTFIDPSQTSPPTTTETFPRFVWAFESVFRNFPAERLWQISHYPDKLPTSSQPTPPTPTPSPAPAPTPTPGP